MWKGTVLTVLQVIVACVDLGLPTRRCQLVKFATMTKQGQWMVNVYALKDSSCILAAARMTAQFRSPMANVCCVRIQAAPDVRTQSAPIARMSTPQISTKMVNVNAYHLLQALMLMGSVVNVKQRAVSYVLPTPLSAMNASILRPPRTMMGNVAAHKGKA